MLSLCCTKESAEWQDLITKKDAEENRTVSGELKVSADLRMVLMLPRIDQFKACWFSKRLIVFNETISELGKKGRDTAVLWHETIAGRKYEKMSSAFHKFIESKRDFKKLALWLGNCSGRKKLDMFYHAAPYSTQSKVGCGTN
ncbi:CAI-1 autoinducer sensor kinase/phosphatase CqsS [Elysia marginata]|uniref:CAI-1 autoinducer sensor kinase/phosphatase CqsS n=1 Tax=Elysia marginata TaxID=1093978 RepID=A0AAV4GF78_9GAST|nr:CAI-1 autoinducer sensor kinase/phosphatase CqsS [Elysia marginata]